jgi:hypothetical protein
VQSIPNQVADRILSEIKALAPTIAARAGEAEAARRIPADIFRMLKSAGIFRMTGPQVHGGLELDFPAVACVLPGTRQDRWIDRVDKYAGQRRPLFYRSCRARPTKKSIEMVLMVFSQERPSPPEQPSQRLVDCG